MITLIHHFSVAISLLALSTVTMAYPNCDIQIDDQGYYEFERLRLDKTQQALLEAFIERLEGDWEGELIQTECKGGVKNPYRLVDSSTVKLEIRSQPKERLSMHANLDFEVQNKKTFYHRILFERPHLFSFTSNGNDNFILTEKSYQRLSPQHGTVLIEIIYKVLFKNEQLYLDIITFSNGFFNSKERWVLKAW